jgi:hypothetical protein
LLLPGEGPGVGHGVAEAVVQGVVADLGDRAEAALDRPAAQPAGDGRAEFVLRLEAERVPQPLADVGAVRVLAR